MVDKVERVFDIHSPLETVAKASGRVYEYRPQQQQMAVAVASHLQQKRSLCIEAPTGVGKTYAYLAPAALHALETGTPVVVSTHTISLQEQILDKDVPALARALGVPFTAVVAKGRSNYVCLRRLQVLGSIDREQVPDAGLLRDLKRIWDWVGTTRTGCLSDLDFEPPRMLWDLVCCERGNCLGTRCAHAHQCFLTQARRRLDKAQVVVTNHAMFFSDLAMKLEADGEAQGVLPAYGAVVLDEAHTIEDTAADHLGVHVGSYPLRRLLNRLYHRERDRERGLLVDGPWGEARNAVMQAAETSTRFFRRIVAWLEPQNQDPLRYTTPNHIPNEIGPLLDAAVRLAAEVAASLAGDPDSESRAQEISAVVAQLRSHADGVEQFLSMGRPDSVYWLERQGRERQDLLFNIAPIAVGPLLRGALFRPEQPVILTSATLAVRGDMSYFKERVGAGEADSLILDSPFDYRRQVTLYLPRDVPTPKDTSRFVPAAANHIRRYLRLSRGRAFVLFTSYSMMRDMAAELNAFFAEEGIRVFIQGDGLPRSKMLQAFREDISSVIFGTASFWTGVDVPGEALSNVIIVRLPFSVPDHPLMAARQEEIERRGGRAFFDYALPEAVLRFRQGFGRLIRTRTDTGMVVVLDSRILGASYGRAFLDSIPACNTVIE